MHAIVRAGSRVLGLYYLLTAYVSAAIMAGIMLLITAEVCARLFFNYSIPIVLDVGGYSLFIVTFLAAAWVLREGGHVVVDMLVGGIKGRPRLVIDNAVLIIGAGLSAFLAYQSGIYTATCWVRGDVIGYPLMIPRGPLLMVLPVGWSFLALEFLMKIWARNVRIKG